MEERPMTELDEDPSEESQRVQIPLPETLFPEDGLARDTYRTNIDLQFDAEGYGRYYDESLNCWRPAYRMDNTITFLNPREEDSEFSSSMDMLPQIRRRELIEKAHLGQRVQPQSTGSIAGSTTQSCTPLASTTTRQRSNSMSNAEYSEWVVLEEVADRIEEPVEERHLVPALNAGLVTSNRLVRRGTGPSSRPRPSSQAKVQMIRTRENGEQLSLGSGQRLSQRLPHYPSEQQDLGLEPPLFNNVVDGPAGPSVFNGSLGKASGDLATDDGRFRGFSFQMELARTFLPHNPHALGHFMELLQSFTIGSTNDSSLPLFSSVSTASRELISPLKSSCFLLSEIFPSRLASALIEIFASRAPYVPAGVILPATMAFELNPGLPQYYRPVPVYYSPIGRNATYGGHYSRNVFASNVPFSFRQGMKTLTPAARAADFPRIVPTCTLPLGPGGRGWPLDESGRTQLPTEIYEDVARYLPRDSLQAMRYVCHELEQNISQILFKNVVVTFRPEIYGMIMQDNSRAAGNYATDVKGKGKAKAIPDDEITSYTGQDYCHVKSTDVVDGMRVFESWGSQIKRFGMAFEVDEVTLANPPRKNHIDGHVSFWGDYKWPFKTYRRYDQCAGLEKKADETSAMAQAFSNLNKVCELALSLDSGLGWLIGPDISDRAQLQEGKPVVFGSQYLEPDVEAIEIEGVLYDLAVGRIVTLARFALENKDAGKPNAANPIHAVRTTYGTFTAQEGPTQMKLDQAEMIDDFGSTYRVTYAPLLSGPIRSRDDGDPKEPSEAYSAPLVPANLRIPQKEWLLETEWAQRAFLASYCLAVVDNSVTFRSVTSLTIAKISSKFLEELHRQDLWDSLPCLEVLNINVAPDWREVSKRPDGWAVLRDIRPSDAVARINDLLEGCVQGAESVKALKVGWIGGGEHAVGIFARNKHVMPAPILRFGDDRESIDIQQLIFLPHVEKLTLTNCWFTPSSLIAFVLEMQELGLKELVLDSVSLTAPTEVALPMPGVFYFTHDAGEHTHVASGAVPASAAHAQWLVATPAEGSWGHVINEITPGETIAYKRYLSGFGDNENLHSFAPSGTLARIEFKSCGYVSLTTMTQFDQTSVGTPVNEVPDGLKKRAAALKSMMSASHDTLLGTIVTHMTFMEKQLLETAWGFEIGWGGDARKDFAREDGQPVGGSGRFSGRLMKQNFVDAMWE